MSEEADPDDNRPAVTLGKHVHYPLSRRQFEELADPWRFLSTLEEFLILCGWFHNSARTVHKFKMMAHVLGPDTVGMPHADVEVFKAGLHLGNLAGLGWPKRVGEFYHPTELQFSSVEDSLAAVKWGSNILKIIEKEEVLTQVWSFKMTEWSLEVDIEWEKLPKIYTHILGAEPDEKLRTAMLAHYEGKSDLAAIDIKILRKIIHELRETYWSRGAAATTEHIDSLNSKYREELKGAIANAQRKFQAFVEPYEEYITAQRQEKNDGPNITVISTDNLRNERGELDPERLTAMMKDLDAKSAARPQSQQESSSPTAPATGSESMSVLPPPVPEKKEEKKFTNVMVQFTSGGKDGNYITLPEGMTYQQGREWLTTIEKEETRTFAFAYKFRGWFPFDAMWAVYRALTEVFGFAHVADFQNWWGPTPPSSVVIDIGYGQKQQIPWGPIQVYGISAPLTPNIDFDNGLPCLNLTATIKNNERGKVDTLMAKAEEILRESSIYRGQAVEVDFEVLSPNNLKFDVARAPKFLDTDIKEEDIILPESVRSLIETNVWTPIRHTAVCREQKIPLRRGALLAGKYGVGKSLASKVTAKICKENGWTFLYLRNLNQLSQALFFAKKYEPCVVFAEDVNRIVSGDRDADMDAIFNVVDGIDRKNDEVMTIFTTNDPDQIHPGMLRPGRIDAIITITPPDAFAAEKLVRHYGRSIIDPDANLAHAGEMLQGQIPAIIRESVERAKLAAIADTKPGEKLIVRAKHLEVAALQLLEHAKLLIPAPEPKPDIVLLGEAVANVMADAMRYRGIPGETKEVAPLAVTAVMDAAGRPNGNGKQHPTT